MRASVEAAARTPANRLDSSAQRCCSGGNPASLDTIEPFRARVQLRRPAPRYKV